MLYFQLNLGYESSNFTGFHDLSFCELKFASSYIMQALAELLPGLRKCGRRVLIFSQWTSMLEILE
jgi:SWI/SNF-related matrix-associated actin-dependent regulator 1 of chromatin subfamily A